MKDSVTRTERRPLVPPSRGKTPYLWLLPLSFMGWKYLYVKPAAFELLMLALTVAVFLPLYFASFWGPVRRTMVIAAVTCGIGVAWMPFNYSAGTFVIFACCMCTALPSVRAGFVAVLAIVLVALGGTLMHPHIPLGAVLPVLCVGLLVGFGTVMEEDQRRSRMQLLRKQEEVEHLATIAERERISRDLHDLLGHTLSLITLKAELAGKLHGRDPDGALREVREIEQSARHALAEVRSAVTGYRQTGFAHELACARASLSAAQVDMTAHIQDFVLPAAAENVMSLALREAVTNIVRHAGATHCEVSLVLQDKMIVFRVVDNGKAQPGRVLQRGNGLNGMRERISALGGQMQLKAGQGLALELALPMHGSAA
jgi:two-component system sensor histidine kinase DesK